MPLFGPPNVERLKAKGNTKGLTKALGYKKDPDVSQAASLALVELGTASVEPLIIALEDDHDALRQAASETLAKLGEPAVEPLIDAIKRYGAREAAAEALVKMGGPAVELAVERLTAALVGKKDDVSAEVEALVQIGAPAVDGLIAVLTDKSVKKMCSIEDAWVMVKRENEEIIPHLGDLTPKVLVFMDTGLNLRGIVACALGETGDTRAVQPLITAIQDEDDFVRWAAAGALFAIGDERALDPLAANLRDDDLLVKGPGAVLMVSADGQTVKQLVPKMRAENPEVRLQATETLKTLGWGSSTGSRVAS